MNRKILVMCIEKQGLKELSQVIKYGEEHAVERLVLLLFNHYIIHEKGLRELLKVLPSEPNFPIHLIHLGLGYNMSVNDYKRVFSEYPNYKLENELLLDVDGFNGKLSFNSNDMESNHWDDEGYETILKQAKGPDFYFTSVELPKSSGYMSEWGESAWRLSQKEDNYLIYMADSHVLEIEINNQYIDVYSNQKLYKHIKK